MSLNLPTHRLNTDGYNHTQQHTLLERATTRFNLQDGYCHLHPSEKYRTWTNTEGVWSSPDHILVSTQLVHRILLAITAEIPWSDHSTVVIDIDCLTSLSIKRITRPRIARNKDDALRYGAEVQTIMAKKTQPKNMNDSIRLLMDVMIQVEKKLWEKKGHVHRHRSKEEIPLLRHLHKVQRWLRTSPLQRRETTINGEVLTTNNAVSILNSLKKEITKQARVRRRACTSVFRGNRSKHFHDNQIKKMLTSALNRYSDYRGILGCITPTGSVTTDPTEVKIQATTRIATEFFRRRTIPPRFLSDSTVQPPPWWNRIFTHTQNPVPSDPIYNSILDPIDITTLNMTLKHMHSNKSGGPSGLVVESFRWLTDTTKTEWLLPMVNHCLSSGTAPTNIKDFQVWATEKIQGEGSMLSHRGKINVRPIALFEPAYKIVESVIQRRLQRCMMKHKRLHTSQYGFTPGKGVDDLLIIYRLLLEDAHHRNKEIHISSNDCSQAYDSTSADTVAPRHGHTPTG